MDALINFVPSKKHIYTLIRVEKIQAMVEKMFKYKL